MDPNAIPIVIFVIAFAVIAFAVIVAREVNKARAKREAEEAYKDSLQKLKRDPNNPDLRQQTLQWGRRYSNLMRNFEGNIIFDEVALTNDINAACAERVKVTNPVPLSGKSVGEEIERLGQLFLTGVITAEEFERGKTLFLGASPDKAASAVELLQNLSKLKKQGVLSESEFNMKKWEILSERLIPGKMQAATLRQNPPARPASPVAVPPTNSVTCPTCGKGIPKEMIVPGLNACPHCQSRYRAKM